MHDRLMAMTPEAAIESLLSSDPRGSAEHTELRVLLVAEWSAIWWSGPAVREAGHAVDSVRPSARTLGESPGHGRRDRESTNVVVGT